MRAKPRVDSIQQYADAISQSVKIQYNFYQIYVPKIGISPNYIQNAQNKDAPNYLQNVHFKFQCKYRAN